MANLSRIAFVLRTIPNLNSEEITGIYPGELFLVGDKKAIFYKQADGTVISPSEAASTFLTIEGNLEDIADKSKARDNLGIKSAALKESGTAKGQVSVVGDFNTFLEESTVLSVLDFNTYKFKSNEIIVLAKTAANNIPVGLDLGTNVVINVMATGTSSKGGFIAFVSDLANEKASYILRCSYGTSSRTFAVESIYTDKHKPSLNDLNVYSKETAKDTFFQISNLFSEIIDDDDKEMARLNLGLGTASVLDKGTAKGNVIVVGDGGLGINDNKVAALKSVIPAFYQLADDSPDKPEVDKDYGVLSFPISKTLTGYLVLSSDGVLSLGIDGADGVELSKVYLANNLPTLTELKALGTENNLSDIKDKTKARTNLGLGDSSTKNVGTETGTVAAGDDSRITGAAQKDKNLEDLTDKSIARTNLELGSAAQKTAQTNITDTTSGSLMQVGAFGLGGPGMPFSGENTDLIEFLRNSPSGMYRFGDSSSYINGIPSGKYSDILLMDHGGSNSKSAIAVDFSGQVFTICLRPDGTNSGWITVFSDTDFSNNLSLPIGVPIPYPLATPPKNFLKANGSAFDQVAFPKLLAYYPSGILPDLRGEFIRGWDDGRNIDTGRALLSSQVSSTIGRYVSGTSSSGVVGVTVYDPDGTYPGDSGWAGVATGLTTKTLAQQRDAIRPRNIAFNYIIRAK
jgi:hypothetical protein